MAALACSGMKVGSGVREEPLPGEGSSGAGVLGSLSVANEDLAAVEVDVLDSDSPGFQGAQSGAVEQHRLET